jgi:two-component system, cell cycle sensor histidine kinase and response regulator CckA
MKSRTENAGRTKLGQETILLVDDEPAILKMTAIMLTRQGYAVVAASSPGEAIRLAREHSGEIHLLITDVIMPEMNGPNLAKQLQSFCPNLKCLFMSGFTGDLITKHGVLEDGVFFIQKPFTAQTLAESMRKALENE